MQGLRFLDFEVDGVVERETGDRGSVELRRHVGDETKL